MPVGDGKQHHRNPNPIDALTEPMAWYVIRTRSGALLSSGESGLAFLFPNEDRAKQWSRPGDTIEPTELRPVDRWAALMGR